MNPDETQLALWMDDELTGEELAAFEAGMGSQPEMQAARAEVRRWREMVSTALESSAEPPYPEFFNLRVVRAIREQAVEPAAVAKRRLSWAALILPLAACAGMVLAFWVGANTHRGTVEVDVAGAPRAIPVEPLVYTPESGVVAERFASKKAAATVIVLNGVAAIPDATDFSKTASIPVDRDRDSTVDVAPEGTERPGL